MEREGCEMQTSIEERCRKTGAAEKDVPDSVAKKAVKFDEKESSFASPTPQKPEWRSKAKGVASYSMNEERLPVDSRKAGVIDRSEEVNPESGLERCPLALSRSPKEEQIELPEKYKTLVDLFNGMESSVRLLGLRKKLPIFANICTQVEILTKRKFLHSHLARMKHLFPEAILIEKMLVHDPRSLCMKPDMKITLVLDIVGCPLHPDQSVSMALCEAFQARLLQFLSAHPRNAEIPEASLPEPFNRSIHTLPLDAQLDGPSVEVAEQTSTDSASMLPTSHLSSSFQRQFSQKVIVPQTQLTQLLVSPSSLVSVSKDIRSNEVSKIMLSKVDCPVSVTKSDAEIVCTPSRGMGSHFSERTPAKHESNTDVLMAETPALQTPKRAITTPLENLVFEDEKSLTEPKLSHSARKSLTFSSSKTGGAAADSVDCTTEEDKAYPYPCRPTIATKRITLEEEIGGQPSTQQHKGDDLTVCATEVQMMRQITRGRRQESLACLLSIFDTVYLISHSTDCSLITKQELVHKIISNNLEIEDTSGIEEQLSLLETFVPEWICKKAASSGDFLYSIKRTSNPESIRARLVEAL